MNRDNAIKGNRKSKSVLATESKIVVTLSEFEESLDNRATEGIRHKSGKADKKKKKKKKTKPRIESWILTLVKKRIMDIDNSRTRFLDLTNPALEIAIPLDMALVKGLRYN